MKTSLFGKCRTGLLTVGIFALMPFTGQAQAPTINWDVTIGGKERDVLTSIDLAEKGYIVGGYSTSRRGGEKGEDSRGGMDYWFARLDENGRIMWEKTYGGDKDDELRHIEKVREGFIIGGTSESSRSGEKKSESRGGKDYWIIKVNEEGDMEWEVTIGGEKDDDLAVIRESPHGGYIVAGTSASPASGEKSEDPKGVDDRTGEGSDYWLVKINEEGKVEWDRTIGGTTYSRLTDLLAEKEGYLLGGYSMTGKAGNDKSEDGYGGYDYWIVKTTPEGDIMWDKTYGGNSTDQLAALAFSGREGEGYVIAGNSSSEPSGTKKDRPVKGTDYWMLKLTPEGDYEWDRVIGSDGSDYLVSIAWKDGNYILGGTSDGNKSGHKSEDRRVVNSHDYWAVMVNEKGEPEWDKVMGGDKNEQGGWFYPTPDGGYIAAGSSSSGPKFEKTDESRGDFDYWIIKLVGCTPIKETVTRSFCKGSAFSLPDGRVVRASGTYTSIVRGKTGCDDTTVTILTELPTYEMIINDTICAGTDYTLPDGRIVRNDGFFRSSFKTTNGGCDSVIIVALALKTIDTTHVSTAICAGGSYTLPGGSVVTQAGVYVDPFVTADGCDSVIVTTLSEDGVDTSVSVFAGELSANSVDGDYQWINCATNQPIPGATSRNFVPDTTGSYAVQITLNGCEATSACHEVEVKQDLSITEIGAGTSALYPNPAKGSFTVDAGSNTVIERVVVVNTLGAVVYQNNPGQQTHLVSVSGLPAGTYMVQVQTKDGLMVHKLQLL